MKKLTHEEYLLQLQNKEILVKPLEEYRGRQQKILHLCVCGNKWEVTPSNVLSGRKCINCKKESLRQQHSKTNEKYLYELKERDILYLPLEKYVEAQKPIKHKCPKGHIWKAAPANILAGRGCPFCRYDKMAETYVMSHDDFILKYQDRINSNIRIVSLYRGANKPIDCECIVCGNKYTTTPSSLIAGHGCKKCANVLVGKQFQKTPEQFEKRFYKLHPTIKMLSPYTKITNTIKCECLICGHIWESIADSLVNQNTGCPICMSSKGERLIFSFLHYNNIDFVIQKTFDGLMGVGGGFLSYDFYLPTYNTLVEYQGEQHESPRKGMARSEEQFVIQQEHDKRKCEYARNHDINLLEIWYYDYNNIEQILTDYLNLNSESVETVIPT